MKFEALRYRSRERYRLKKLALFGSYARGEATEQSDLDFFADIPDDFGLFRIAELQNDLEDAFHKKIDLVTSGMLNDSLSAQFSQNIEEDEVLLYSGSK
ncbi:MAG: nucleotidyltransferase domain-containing protein [Oscillospiraceae bacterium]